MERLDQWEDAELKKNFFWYPAQKKLSPGRMAETSRAGTGDSVGWFRHYRCSALLNYHSNLSVCCTFLQKSIHLPDNCGWLATPKEIYDLNLSAVTLNIWSFRTSTSIFCTKELYNPVFFSLASISRKKNQNLRLGRGLGGGRPGCPSVEQVACVYGVGWCAAWVVKSCASSNKRCLY